MKRGFALVVLVLTMSMISGCATVEAVSTNERIEVQTTGSLKNDADVSRTARLPAHSLSSNSLKESVSTTTSKMITAISPTNTQSSIPCKTISQCSTVQTTSVLSTTSYQLQKDIVKTENAIPTTASKKDELLSNDPWKYPFDVATCIVDCQAYIASYGECWDESLTFENSSWAGYISTVQSALHPDEYSLKAEVMEAIDYTLCLYKGEHIRVLFRPDTEALAKGNYRIYILHF